ncbi:hypothetical protein V1260_06990 [Brachybacterium sp. J144]|uniref:hypothetical protein n=1 Tax=Brachybacterium sp. J144 TaxID=3116487 RepID=UPI002E75C465|nr:hypothetical protein [Brachybacterium sp. J144]MEE1650535.1 hypothetical protein [Brachybacterium sp. J144]
MSSPRDRSSGYDWAESATPSDPAPITLPDRRAEGPVPITTPSDPAPWAPVPGPDPVDPLAPPASARSGTEEGFDPAALGRPDPDALPRELPSGPHGAPLFGWDEPDDPAEDPERRARRSRRAVLIGIVALQAAAVLIIGGLALRGAMDLVGPEPAPGAADPGAAPTGPAAPRTTPAAPTGATGPSDPGTVTDAQERELADGTGAYDSPGEVGVHTFSWPTWTDGTLSVTALAVDPEATLPAAAGEDVIQEGYRLVSVTYEARYEGPGTFAPVEELWLTAETDRTYYQDVAVGLVADPMRSAPKLRDGESARFTSLFIVAEDELEGVRLGAQTFDGEMLYYAVR